VVDSFSEDDTLSIARQHSRVVVQSKWPGMVGAQRNVGLDMATSPWVLFLDADERVTEELQGELHRFVRRDDAILFAGGEIPRKNYFFGKWLKSSYPDFTRRLLRRGAGRFNETPGRGFDTLLFSDGSVFRFRGPLIHWTGETLAQRMRKLDFDTTLQAEEKFRAGKRVPFLGLLVNPLLAFLRVYFLKKGFLDGSRGFVYACLVSFNTFMKYAKLWEKRLS
jgi:glycosyltransferase involved in cell wall biosynthesis